MVSLLKSYMMSSEYQIFWFEFLGESSWWKCSTVSLWDILINLTNRGL